MATLTPSNGIDGQQKLILPPPSMVAPPSPKDTERNGNVWLRIQFRTICEICVSMPLIGLVACFIVSMIFQFEHIQETACKVSYQSILINTINCQKTPKKWQCLASHTISDYLQNICFHALKRPSGMSYC